MRNLLKDCYNLIIRRKRKASGLLIINDGYDNLGPATKDDGAVSGLPDYGLHGQDKLIVTEGTLVTPSGKLLRLQSAILLSGDPENPTAHFPS